MSGTGGPLGLPDRQRSAKTNQGRKAGHGQEVEQGRQGRRGSQDRGRGGRGPGRRRPRAVPLRVGPPVQGVPRPRGARRVGRAADREQAALRRPARRVRHRGHARARPGRDRAREAFRGARRAHRHAGHRAADGGAGRAPRHRGDHAGAPDAGHLRRPRPGPGRRAAARPGQRAGHRRVLGDPARARARGCGTCWTPPARVWTSRSTRTSPSGSSRAPRSPPRRRCPWSTPTPRPTRP